MSFWTGQRRPGEVGIDLGQVGVDLGQVGIDLGRKISTWVGISLAPKIGRRPDFDLGRKIFNLGRNNFDLGRNFPGSEKLASARLRPGSEFRPGSELPWLRKSGIDLTSTWVGKNST